MFFKVTSKKNSKTGLVYNEEDQEHILHSKGVQLQFFFSVEFSFGARYISFMLHLSYRQHWLQSKQTNVGSFFKYFFRIVYDNASLSWKRGLVLPDVFVIIAPKHPNYRRDAKYTDRRTDEDWTTTRRTIVCKRRKSTGSPKKAGESSTSLLQMIMGHLFFFYVSIFQWRYHYVQTLFSLVASYFGKQL